MKRKEYSDLVTGSGRLDFVLGLLGCLAVLIILGNVGSWYANSQWAQYHVELPWHASLKYLFVSIAAVAAADFVLYERYPYVGRGVWVLCILAALGSAAAYQFNSLFANLSIN